MICKRMLASAFLVFALVSPVTITTGCKSAQLSQTGPYKGDKVLYNADKTITSAYKLAHDFVTWEYNNRNALPLQVTQAADAVRANTKRAIDGAIAVRDAYANNPNKDNESNLDTALSIMASALAEVGKIMNDNSAAQGLVNPRQ